MNVLVIGSGNDKKAYEGHVVRLDKDLYEYADGEFVQHDPEETPLPFEDDQFDAIIASHVLEHIRNLCPLMDELHRILKPDGVLRIWIPYYKHSAAFKDPTHVRYFTPSTFGYFTYSRNYNVVNRFWKVKLVKKIPLTAYYNFSRGGRFLRNRSVRKIVYTLLRPVFHFVTRDLYAELTPVKDQRTGVCPKCLRQLDFDGDGYYCPHCEDYMPPDAVDEWLEENDPYAWRMNK